MPSWFYDNWFISISSIVIALAIEPLIMSVIHNIRALFGEFSGTYISMAGEPNANTVVIELVRCKHIGHQIRGEIAGVSFAKIQQDGELEEISRNDGVYKFSGIVDERMLVLSFHTKVRGAKGSGTLALQGDNSGNIFTGVWGGLDVDEVVSSPCVWIKTKKDINVIKDREIIISDAHRFLVVEKSPWKTGRTSLFYLDGVGGLGKTKFMEEILKAKEENTNKAPTQKRAKKSRSRKRT